MGLLAVPLMGASPSSATSGATDSNVRAVCPAPAPGEAQCLALVRTDIAGPAGSEATPATSGGPYGPSDIQAAYALPSGTAGAGMTVAVVDAYDLPTAETDLAAYRSFFGLPACPTTNGCFRKVNEYGVQGSYPAVDTGWGTEIALDIDMVSAACPKCDILLVEAASASYSDLGRAVDTAVSLGAVAVSNSYGGAEWSGETSDDVHYDHPGVAITASTGDCGYECAGDVESASYPAASPYVVAVGGTTLTKGGGTRGWTESAWGAGANSGSGTGSGCSAYEPKPAWQTDPDCAKRTEADVSAVADPNTGVWVYWDGQWGVCGGTSAASPIIASVFALAGNPAAGTNPASYLYAGRSHLFDVTAGNNDVTWGDCSVAYLCNGGPGYDGPTGLGTPNGTVAFAEPLIPSAPTGLAATAGDGSADLTWSPPTTAADAVSGYVVTETEHGLGVVDCAYAAATECAVAGLEDGTEYTFTVHATSAAGPGPESEPSNPVTPEPPTVPGQATQVVAVAGISSASVSWAPAPANRSAIDSYSVLSEPGAQTCTAAGDTSCSVAGLTIGQKYTFTVTAHNGVGDGPASDPSNPVTPVAGDTYHPIAPVRLLDTRSGNGLSGKLLPGQPRTFQVTGRATIPAGATALTANLTIVNASSASEVYVGASPLAHPATYSIRFNRLDTTAYGVTLQLSASGTLSATYMASSGSTDLVMDVTGYFTADGSGSTYHPLTPARLLDTRSHNGLAGPFQVNSPRTFVVAGRGGVPADATAVTGNLTVTDVTGSWAAYLGPAPIAKPGSSTINFVKKQTRANSLTVVLGSGGTLSATFMGSGRSTIDMVFDVTGYYTADDTGASYVPMTATRLLDTSVGNGLSTKLTANVPQAFQITGRGGIPTEATAVTGTISAVGQTSSWALFVGPVPTAKPNTSSVNFLPTDADANGVTVALGSGGTLSVTYMGPARNTTNVVLDVTGYFLSRAPSQDSSFAVDMTDARADRWQNPDYTACTAAATMSMLNDIAYAGTDPDLAWTPTTSYTTQESILAYERANMTMLTTSPGTDPHGWRNALNYYGWGSITAGVYKDASFTSFNAAAKAAVSALAMYHKPVGILALAGGHGEYITGYVVTGDDPSTGSTNFNIVGVDLSDPYEQNGHRDLWVTLSEWEDGSAWIQFYPYMQTDSPYRDPIDGQIGYDEWYGKWVIIEPVK